MMFATFGFLATERKKDDSSFRLAVAFSVSWGVKWFVVLWQGLGKKPFGILNHLLEDGGGKFRGKVSP
eukprot:684838-Amphidinium_carterae.1